MDEKEPVDRTIGEIKVLCQQQAILNATLERLLIERDIKDEINELIGVVKENVSFQQKLLASVLHDERRQKITDEEDDDELRGERQMEDTTAVLTKLGELSSKIDTEGRLNAANLLHANEMWATQLKGLATQMEKDRESQLNVIASKIDAGDAVAKQRSESAEKAANLAIAGQTQVKNFAYVVVTSVAGAMLVAMLFLFHQANDHTDALAKEVNAKFEKVDQRFDKMDQKLDLILAKKK